MNDDIIGTIRDIKVELARQFSFDIGRLIADIKRTEQLSAQNGRVLVDAPQGNVPPSVFHKIRFSSP